MLAIRLQRVGRTNDPSFRIIVQDHRRSPKKTRGLAEYVGSYDARKGKPQINAERVKYWISMGAQPSDTVHNLLVDANIIVSNKVNAMNKKTKPVKEVPKEEAKKPTPVAVAPVAVAPKEEQVVEAAVVAAAPKAEEKTAAKEEKKAEDKKEAVVTNVVADSDPIEKATVSETPAAE